MTVLFGQPRSGIPSFRFSARTSIFECFYALSLFVSRRSSPACPYSVSSLSSTFLTPCQYLSLSRALTLSLNPMRRSPRRTHICQLLYATPTHKPSKFMSVCVCVCVCVDDSGRNSDFHMFSITIKSWQNDNFHLIMIDKAMELKGHYTNSRH